MPSPAIQSVVLQSRRFLGNKTKLLDFIASTVLEHLPQVGVAVAPQSVVDIFSGTGSVAARFNGPETRVLANDLLPSNQVCLNAWLGNGEVREARVKEAAIVLVSGTAYAKDAGKTDEGQAAVEQKHAALVTELLGVVVGDALAQAYGGKYFSDSTVRAIANWRARLPQVAQAFKLNQREHDVLLAGILYTADRHAQTFGHFEAYQKKPGAGRTLTFLLPSVPTALNNVGNVILGHDATTLASFLDCDVLYLDPPYNSRQYGAAYHVLDVLAGGVVPTVEGVARKPTHDLAWESSDYCTKSAPQALEALVSKAKARLIVMSYSNMEEKGDGRSNAKISGQEIEQILAKRGKVFVVGKAHKAFSTGKTDLGDHQELLYVCHVGKF